MALLMANTSNVKEMKNGRPESVLLKDKTGATEGTLPNCAIVSVGDVVEGDHVREAKALAATNAAGKFVVVAPEINVEQYRTVDGQIGKFVLEVGETYTAYQLSVLDRLEYSDAYFKDATALKVGDKVNVQQKDANGARFAKADTGGAMRIVSIVPLWLPVMLAPNLATGQGSGKTAKLMPESCKMIKVEVEQ